MRSRRSERRRGQSESPVAAGAPSIVGYRDLTVIGRGASATVYRATQEAFGRTVAIKVLHVDVSDRRAQRRFEREKAINGRLSNHPNVVTVLESGFVDGRYPYLAMEFFEHGSLSGRLAERGPFDISEALHVGIRIAGALESAHAMGVLHRDVKPQNILLSRFGEPALADFGIATILELEHSVTAGLTPVHAAPEILEGADPSPSSDVYALGSTVYTLLSGAPPFAGPPGEGVLAQLLRITTMDLPAMGRTDVPSSLVLALREATAKHPEDRTPTAAAFGRLLQMVQDDLGLGRTSLPLDVPADVPAPPRHQRAEPTRPSPWSPPPPVPPVAAEAPGSPALAASPPPPRPSPPPSLPSTEASLPEAAIPPLVDMGDVTLDGSDDHPTVSARQLHPAQPEPRRSRRWVGVAAVSAVAVAVGAVAASAYTNGRQWEGEVAPRAEGTDEIAIPATTESGEGKNDFGPAGASSADETTGETSAPSAEQSTEPSTAESTGESTGPTLPEDPEDWAPQGVVLSTTGDTPVLYWRDRSGGVAGHVVRSDRPVEGWSNAYVPAGTELVEVSVAPGVEGCFQVSAVIFAGEPGVSADTVPGRPGWVCLPGSEPLSSSTMST